MRTILSLYLLMVIGAAMSPCFAQQPCTSKDDFRQEFCVSTVATFRCRNARSMKDLRICFDQEARKLIGPDYKGPYTPDCTKQNAVSASCALNPAWGAGDEWCYRSSPDTIHMCEGDPPGQKCRTVQCGFDQQGCGCTFVIVNF